MLPDTTILCNPFSQVMPLQQSSQYALKHTQKTMTRDQLNSRFHGCDIFREIDLLP